ARVRNQIEVALAATRKQMTQNPFASPRAEGENAFGMRPPSRGPAAERLRQGIAPRTPPEHAVCRFSDRVNRGGLAAARPATFASGDADRRGRRAPAAPVLR